VLDRLTDALDQALDDETTRKRLFDLGADVPPKARRGQQPLADHVKSEMARWASVMGRLRSKLMTRLVTCFCSGTLPRW
jgi:putative tricarboxylic transport membrane protein